MCLSAGARKGGLESVSGTCGLDLVDGSLTLLSAVPEGMLHNPAFCRRHPTKNIVYACTESVKQDGQIVALELSSSSTPRGVFSDFCFRFGLVLAWFGDGFPGQNQTHRPTPPC